MDSGDAAPWLFAALGAILVIAVGASTAAAPGTVPSFVAATAVPVTVGVAHLCFGLWLAYVGDGERLGATPLWTALGVVLGLATSLWIAAIVTGEPLFTSRAWLAHLHVAASGMAAATIAGYLVSRRGATAEPLAPTPGEGAGLRSLLDGLPVAVLLVDGAGTVQYANDAVTDLFGDPENALRGESIERLFEEPIPGLLDGSGPGSLEGAVDPGTDASGGAESTEDGTVRLRATRPDGSATTVAGRVEEGRIGETPYTVGVFRPVGEGDGDAATSDLADRLGTFADVTASLWGADTRAIVYQRAVEGAMDLSPADGARFLVEADDEMDVAATVGRDVGTAEAGIVAALARESLRTDSAVQMADISLTRSAMEADAPGAIDDRDDGPRAARPTAESESATESASPSPAPDGPPATEGDGDAASIRSVLSLPVGGTGVVQLLAVDVDAFDEVDLAAARALARLVGRCLATVESRTEEESAGLENLVSALVHDIRNPLTVAQGRVEMLESGVEPATQLDAIQRSHERIEQLIDDALTLAKQQQLVEETEPVPLTVVANEDWRTVATGEAELWTSSLGTVDADPSRLQQLFENLFRNATQHAGEDVAVQVGSLEDGFYVEDDGPGIPEEIRDAVFESGVSGRQGGTGIGLTVVPQIAEAHDWTVTATDGSTGGARLEFTDVDVEDA